MIKVAIQEELLEPIRRVAEQEKTSVESLVNDWLRRQLALVREQKIHEETARFRAKHAELRVKYLGQHIAMRNGEVVDHDSDARKLYLRVRKQYGDSPILIAPVGEQPIQTYQMRSPRLAGSTS